MIARLWVVVLCGGAMLGLVMGIRQGLGLFVIPIGSSLGIGRETFSLAMGLSNLIWGLASPIGGAIADRWGAGRVAAAGGLLYAAGLAAMTAGGDGSQLLAGGVLTGLGLSGTGFAVALGAVGRAAAPESRARALALASLGGSIGQFVALPYIHLLIDALGWAAALLVLAATAAAIVPLARGIAGQPTTPGAGAQTMRQALAAAGAHRGFWLLTAGFFVCGFQLAFISVHLPPYLGDKGLPAWLGAAALSLVGLANIVGTYGCGALGEHYAKKSVLSLLYLVRGLLLLAFLAVPVTETSVLVFSAAMGFLWLGTVPLTGGLVAHFFGPTYMSMLFGIAFLSHQIGGFFGAWVAGLAYDATGSCDAMWWLSAALGFAAAALHWPIEERTAPRAAAAR